MQEAVTQVVTPSPDAPEQVRIVLTSNLTGIRVGIHHNPLGAHVRESFYLTIEEALDALAHDVRGSIHDMTVGRRNA